MPAKLKGACLQNSDQPSDAVWSRNVVEYKAVTRATHWRDRGEDATVDVRSDTQV